MDPQIQQLLQALGQLTGAAANSRSSMANAGQAMAKLRLEMQKGTGTIQSQSAALQNSISQFANLDAATQRSTAGQRMLAEQAQAASEIFRSAAGSISAGILKGGLVESIQYVSKQILTTISSYQEGATGFQTAFNIQNAAMQSQISILDRLSTGAEQAAAMLAMIPSPLARLASGITGAVAAAAAFGKSYSEEQVKYMQAFQKEISTTVMSFDILQKNGVLLAGGMTQTRKISGELGLNLNEFTKVVATNRKELADFGNSVVGGIKKIRNVSIAFTDLSKRGLDLRKELEMAGINQQEQTEGLVEYMDMMNKAGRLRNMSDEQIALGSTEYLKNLKAISAFTGEDVKSAKARAKAMADELAVRDKLEEMGGEARQKFEAAVELLGPEMGKALQQMFLTGGAVVDKSLAITLAQSPTQKALLDKVFADLSNQSVATKDVVANYQTSVKENADALKAEKKEMARGIGVTAALTGKYSDVARMGAGIDDLANKGLAAREAEVAALGNTVEQLRKTITEGIDPFKQAIVDAERQSRERLPRLINDLTGVTQAYINTIGGGKGMAEMMRQQEQQMREGMTKYLQMMAKTPVLTEPGTNVSKAMTGAVDLLLTGVQKLNDAARNLFAYSEKLLKTPGRQTGSLGTTGKLFENFGEGTLVKLHGVESVMTPKNVQDLLENAQTGMLKGLSIGTKAPEVDDKLTDTVTSTLNSLTTQITTTNQMQIGKLDELISTMRDKTIWEDMLRAMEDNVGYTKRIADNS